MFDNIPAALRDLPQWVCAGENKIPINPRTGQAADPCNPSTGGTFLEAIHAGMKHIGFILSKDDPYTIIDLDNPFERNVNGVKSIIGPSDPDWPEAIARRDRHNAIYYSFNTYAELSQSGTGAHLVMRGSIPCGVRRDKVEIYSAERYIIFTGKVLRNEGVNDCQPLLDGMFSQMGKLIDKTGELIEEDPIKEDATIWRMAVKADNGEKFVNLCEGNWTQYGYPSQSEADYGLISMFAFYTRSNEQVRRMFRQTALGQRKKAQKNDYYINKSLSGIRAKEPPLISIADLLPTMPRVETVEPEPMPVPETSAEAYSFPPGLVGDVAAYIYSSAIRQVKEVALAASLALCAGVCGRSYNISGTGLNQYIILLANTGRGKEGAATGIDNLIAAVRGKVPMVEGFLGPAAFSSGQAMVKVLNKKPCFVSIFGEFGLLLQQLCHPDPKDHHLTMKKVLLDVYNKSGHSKVLRASAYSDSDKDTSLVQAPNMSIFGESNPKTFFKGVDSSHIADGLLPRFTIIEYTGIRPPKNGKAFHPPTDELADRFGDLVAKAIQGQMGNTCIPIGMTAEAQKFIDDFGTEADRKINAATLDTDVEIWNRAELKVLKMAGLVAVGVNPHEPIVTIELARWAHNLVRFEIQNLLDRLNGDEMATGEAGQEAEIKRLFRHFQNLTDVQRRYHRCPEELMRSQVCPLQYLTTYSRRLACFKNERMGPSKALDAALDSMVRRDILERIPLDQLQNQFKTRSPIYIPGPAWE